MPKRASKKAECQSWMKGVPAEVKEGKLLGKGAFGAVYKVTISDPLLDNNEPLEAALKKMTLKNENDVEDFWGEVESLLAASNLRVYAADADDESDFPKHAQLFVEYVPGMSVFKWAGQQEVDLLIAARLFIYLLLNARDNWKKSGVVHRDIKPENIMVEMSEDGDTWNFQLIDFGLVCRARDRDNDQGFEYLGECSAGGLAGTPGYISRDYLLLSSKKFPKSEKDIIRQEYDTCDTFEQRDDWEARLLIRNELFSIAATVYFLLTGDDFFTPSGDFEEYRQNIMTADNVNVWPIELARDTLTDLLERTNPDIPAHERKVFINTLVDTLDPDKRCLNPTDLLTVMKNLSSTKFIYKQETKRLKQQESQADICILQGR